MLPEISPRTSAPDVEYVALGTLVRSVSVRGYQVTTDKYEADGDFPIVDQGKALIVGYTSEQQPLPCNLPVTVFGDHTREVKFVAFPFVAGADGIKVLEPADGQVPRYLNALIEYAAERISNLGYSRHYKELKEAVVPYLADPAEQQRVAAVLRAWDTAIATAERLVEEQRVQFRAILSQITAGLVSTRLDNVAAISRCAPNIGVQQAQEAGAPLFTAGGMTGRYSPAAHHGAAIILSAIGAQCGKCFYADGDWTAGANTMIVTPKDETYSRFLFHYLNTIQPWPIQGSGQPYISPANARRSPVPDIDGITAQRLGNILDCSSKLTTQAKHRVAALRRQKRGLMQLLLTGTLRVPEGINALIPAALEAAE